MRRNVPDDLPEKWKKKSNKRSNHWMQRAYENAALLRLYNAHPVLKHAHVAYQ
jgi:hypothetical protein